MRTIDLRPRCKHCNKIPRGRGRIAAYEIYKPFCSFHCQEMANMKSNLAYCAERFAHLRR